MAIKLHFGSPKYDYIKYEGKINAKLDTFTSRNDRYFFHKLSKKYKEEEIVDFFVSNFAKNDKVWSKQLLEDEYNQTFLRFRKYKESVNYHFRSDCSLLNDRFISDGISFNDGFRISGGQHPPVLRLLIQRKINIQTAIILDSILSYSKNWSKDIDKYIDILENEAVLITLIYNHLNMNKSININYLEKILTYIKNASSYFTNKLTLTTAKNCFFNEVFEASVQKTKLIHYFNIVIQVECEDCTRAIVKVYSNASKIRMEPDER